MDDLVQSTPFVPPIDGTTQSHIFLFGDLTFAFEQDLRQLLHIKDNASLQAFFDHVAGAFRHEFSLLPAREQEWLPRFTTLIDLLANLDGTEGAPAMRFALFCLHQLGRFICHFAEGSRPYPSAANTYLLGLCTGSFATAAIATSQTIAELIPAATEAVLVAFRTGLHSLKLQRDVEKPLPDVSRSWSVAVSLSEEQAVGVVQNFGVETSLPKSSHPYISAVGPSNVTISGPPSVLQDLLESRALRAHHFSIESPYHASHLYGVEDVDEVLGQLRDKRLEAYKPRIPILSPVSGQLVATKDFKGLLHQAVTDTLCEQVRWDRILSSCAEGVSQHVSRRSCTIWPVASNAVTLLSSTLSTTTGLSISICNSLSTGIEAAQPTTPTGKFRDSKIAITGFSGRFPEAASNDEFWELLRAGRDTHRTIPEDRFDWQAHFDPTGKKKNTSRVRYGCFINEPGVFDARFFNLSPREAENTDPAQRLALTTAYEALEMAGLVPDRTPSTQRDRIGVFYGVTSDDWREVNSRQNIDTYFIPGGNRAFVPGRISYFFRFSGPSLSIDTACSSSFAAIQIACSYLWQGNCDTAVAGGTNVLTNPDNFAGLDRGHFLSTTGNCNPFDDAATGYCRADAVGSVVLKRLEDAEADNDPIFGVIAGSNTNHCGQTVSITRPHEGDQVSLFKRILRHSNTDPLHVSYVEMHGTGTQAGDATEMKSVLSAFVPGHERMPRYPLHLGAVKGNIGHSESASGVSALIKVLLMMQKDEIPPHCGIKNRINRNYPLDLTDRNVNIAFKPTPWRRTDCAGGKRVAFLNNFSAAGGNTAILLEDATNSRREHGGQDLRTVHPVTITAKSLKSLKDNIAGLIAYLERYPDTSLPALSYTTTARRTHHKYRIAFAGVDINSIKDGLKLRISNCDVKAIPSATKLPNVVWVFTGQGTLYAGIGRQLFESVTQFRTDILRFDRIAQRQGFPSFLQMVACRAGEIDIGSVDTVVAHLALVCVQMALSRLWMSWGVFPNSVVGHSLGEYAALFAAGVLTASDTIYIVGTRAHLLSEHCTKATHSMLAIKAPLNAVALHLAGSSCDVACINSPTNTVVSGPSQEIDRLMEAYRLQGHECVTLSIPYAFHSAQVDPFLEKFEAAIGKVRFSVPSVPYMSPLLARTVSDAGVLNSSYLSQACRSTVNFHGALQAARESAIVGEQTIWLEIGSHPACSGMIKGIFGPQVMVVPSLKKDTDAWKILAESLQSLYLSGIEIHWHEYHRDFQTSQKVLPLPGYSWDLKNYWIQYRNNFCLTKGDDPIPKQHTAVARNINFTPAFLSASVHRVLEEHNAADVSTLLVESDIHDQRLAPIIQAHRVNGVPLCPSSLYADMALTIAQHMLKANSMWTEEMGLDCSTMKVERPLIAAAGLDPQLLRVSASADWSHGLISLAFFSVNARSQKTADHATCLIRLTPRQTWVEDWKRNTYLIKSRISSLHQGVDGGKPHKLKRGIVYKLFSAFVDYSSRYQGMQEVVLDSDGLEATAQVVFQVGDEGFNWSPCWIDSLGHIAGFIMNGNDNAHSKDQVFVNHGWDAMRCAKRLEYGKTYQTYNKMQLMSGTMYVGDTYILDDGVVVAIFEGIKFQGVPRQVLDQLLPSKAKAAKSVPTQCPSATTGAREPGKSKVVPGAGLLKKADSVPAPESTALHRGQLARTTMKSNIVSRLMAIISEEAGLGPAELEPDSQFADLGIDSLLSLTISGRLQEELGLDLSSSVFADYLTLKDLTDHLGGSGTLSPASTLSSGGTTPESSDDDRHDQTDATSIDEDHDVMEIIRTTIAQETGAPLQDLTPSTKLSELGVDSLLTLTIMGTLCEKLDMDLPPTLLADNDTLYDVENTLGMNGYLRSAPTDSIMTSGKSRDVTVPMEPPQLLLHAPPHATSVVLQGSSRTAKRALFLFPDGSGSATSYASLPNISPELVVYGLNCPWMRTPHELKCSLEQYTAKFLVEVRRRQPTGPYYFGGWSAGGICAYEAAQQLARSEEMTAKLILIDSPNPVGLENPPQRMYDFLDSLDLFGMNGKTPPSWLRPHFDAFIQMLDAYKVKAFGEMTAPMTHMIYARDGLCKHPGDPRPEVRPDDPREMLWLLNNRTDFSGGGWRDLVGGENMRVQVVDNVNHYTMMAPGAKAGELSALIATAIEQQ